MTPADLAPLAHWTLAAKHRILWRLFLTAALTLCFTILLFRSNAEDPRKNYIESQKAVLAMAPPPIPDVENAAVDYRNAFKLFVPGSSTDDPEGNLDREGPFFQTPLVAAYFTANAPAFALLERGAAKSKCNWNLDYSAGVFISMDHMTTMRRAARMFAARARLRAQQGDHVGAAADFKRINRLAEHMGSDAYLLSGLVENSLLDISESALQWILVESPSLSVASLSAYRDAMPLHQNPQGRFLQIAECEMQLQLVTMDGLASRQDPSLSRAMLANLGGSNTATVESEPVQLLFGALLYGSERKTMLALSREVRETVQAGKVCSDDSEIIKHSSFGPAIVTQATMPAFSRTQASFLRAADKRLCVDAALAVLLFRSKYASDPHSIAELVPEFLPTIPVDYFNHKPVTMIKIDKLTEIIYSRYRWRPKPLPSGRSIPPGSIRVYTFGRDGRDDKGQSYDFVELINGNPAKGDDSSFFAPAWK